MMPKKYVDSPLWCECGKRAAHAGVSLSFDRAISIKIADDGGLLLCSWPKGGKLSLPFVYSDEVWTGIEYQVAAHLMELGAEVRTSLDRPSIGRALAAHLGDHAGERALWTRVRDRYAVLIAPLLDQELYKTFFNTLTRRFFRTRGVAPDIEFVALDIVPTDRITHPVARHSYAVSDDLAATFGRLLGDYDFGLAFAESMALHSLRRIAARLQ